MHRFLGYLCLLLAVARADDGAAIRSALAALERDDSAAAEKILRPEVNARPNDASALTLLGVALDKQKRFPEADGFHRRAASSAPNSPDVWNNYANHLLSAGDGPGARRCYLRVVTLDPANRNANIQLARLALAAGKGAEALDYLRHLPGNQQDTPNLAPLRMAALRLAGETRQADDLTAHWLADSRNNLGESFSIGLALADAGDYRAADSFFTQALALAPADFNVLSNLGVVLWHTGDYRRAQEVLESARRQQPRNADVLYPLAGVDHADGRNEAALALLAQAGHLAPQRSDIQKLLAITTGDLGALEDSAAAWDRYIQLEPHDDVGRRERGFTAFKRGRFEQAQADIQWYVDRHPDDPVGRYELGAIENKENPAQALTEYSRALELKPDFGAARSERGSLYYQMGKPEQALADLEAAVTLRPDDPTSLDRLGQTYLALDRPADAVRVLRHAAALSPDDSKMQLHLARALADAGESAESKAAMDRFRQMGPVVNHAVPGGLVDYLSLTPEERHADYRRRVERLVREHPEDPAAELDYLQILLNDGDAGRAADAARRLGQIKAPATTLAAAGRALLEAGEYAPARELLEQAALSAPPAGVRLDLARAAFQAAGPAEGLRLLDKVPESEQNWDFYLTQAEMRDAAGDAAGGQEALAQALRASPGDAAPYVQSCLYLLRKGRAGDAARISGDAAKRLPQDREVLLVRAAALELSGGSADARTTLEQIENRWPEWPAAWALDGIVLAMRGHRDRAIAPLRTAVALGANIKELKSYLDAGGNPPDLVDVLTRCLRAPPPH